MGLSAAEYRGIFTLGNQFFGKTEDLLNVVQEISAEAGAGSVSPGRYLVFLFLSHSYGRGLFPAVLYFRGMIPANQSLCLSSASTDEFLQLEITRGKSSLQMQHLSL